MRLTEAVLDISPLARVESVVIMGATATLLDGAALMWFPQIYENPAVSEAKQLVSISPLSTWRCMDPMGRRRSVSHRACHLINIDINEHMPNINLYLCPFPDSSVQYFLNKLYSVEIQRMISIEVSRVFVSYRYDSMPVISSSDGHGDKCFPTSNGCSFHNGCAFVSISPSGSAPLLPDPHSPHSRVTR